MYGHMNVKFLLYCNTVVFPVVLNAYICILHVSQQTRVRVSVLMFWMALLIHSQLWWSSAVLVHAILSPHEIVTSKGLDGGSRFEMVRLPSAYP